MALVECAGVASEHELHEKGEVRLGHPHVEVRVRLEIGEGEDRDARLTGGFTSDRGEGVGVACIQDDPTPIVAVEADVMEGAGGVTAVSRGHLISVPDPPRLHNWLFRTIL